MRSLIGFRLVFVCALSVVSSLLIPLDRIAAQERKGGISGHVTDNSGSVLQGARIELQPVGTIVASNIQGEFFINDVTPGTFTVSITFVGFNQFTKQVTVAAGQIATVDAKLEVESQNLEVLVTAERASGEAAAVNRELTADNIVQVLPSEVIRSLPNANMADALGRLPSVTIERDEGEGKYVQLRGTEPRLANLTIDGVNTPSPESGVRQIKLDAIPADIVDSVEINKTLQANMDPDGIGGSVNLVTKTAGERPTVNISGMGGYTPITNGRGLVETAGTVGQRFGPNKRFGALIGGTYDWNGRGIDDLEPVPDIATFPGGSSARYFEAIDIREYRYYRSRWGLAGSVDYKPSDGSTIYIRGLYSDFKNYGDRWVYSLTDNTQGIKLLGSNGCATDPTTGLTTAPCTGVPSFNDQIRRPDYGIGSILLGGKHVLTTTWYAWDISASRSRQLGQIGDRTASFNADGLATSSFQYDLANTKSFYLPQWTPACFTEAYTNQSNFPLHRMQTNHGLTAQLNLQGSGAVAKRYHLRSRLSTIEIGAKFRNAHKFANTFTDNFSSSGTGTPLLLSQFSNKLTNNNYYNGAYKLGPNPNFFDIYNAFLADKSANPNNYSLSTDTSSQFDLIEKVSAGYVMNTIDFNKIRLVAGVRFEGTNLDTVTPIFDANNNFLGNTKLNGSYVKVLPSASLRFALKSDTNLRLVYSRGFSRPDPQEIAQAVSKDTSVTPNVISLGNPNLKPETADNVDVLFEHYLNPFGVITAGYFYKNLVDPIVTHQCNPPTNCQPFPGAIVTQPINAGSAWINGFEAAYLQHLTFLPGAFAGLGISANYGYTASRTSFGPDFSRTDHPRLVRNAPHTWNVSPTYDRGRVSLRVGLSYNAQNIAGYGDGTSRPTGDNYFYPHLQFDAQGSVKMARGLTFVMYGLNINNEVFGFYNGSPQYMVQREFYKPTIAAGLRWSPLHEK